MADERSDVAKMAAEGLKPEEGFVTSPVLRALRFPGEEVQLGAVLASICQEPAVATAFANAVIARTRHGNPAARRRAKRDHGAVTCLGEQQLTVRLTRRLSRARAADLGRVDLRFRGSAGWDFGVELKLNSDFGHEQLERYAQSGLVAAIVRTRRRYRTCVTTRIGWVPRVGRG